MRDSYHPGSLKNLCRGNWEALKVWEQSRDINGYASGRLIRWLRGSQWRRKWQPTPVLLPGESHRWRSLVGYSLWGHKESETTEQLHFTHFTHFILYHWRGKWQPTPVFLSGGSHGQRSLAGHGPRGRRESDTTEVTEHAHGSQTISIKLQRVLMRETWNL